MDKNKVGNKGMGSGSSGRDERTLRTVRQAAAIWWRRNPRRYRSGYCTSDLPRFSHYQKIIVEENDLE